eukprot:TRINITY_DN37884_c0_g1_i1.p1 TRINITY_DN37884_c0_g1~~TRINITY_DN37884_c0_g1_i1.p1  ORF type:complete len:162 (+),score=13.90 TRINITY_DN37884_c0_g1_i1:347-832(+)
MYRQYSTLVRQFHINTIFKGRIDRRKLPKISEDDLEEKFVKGWGPGGQSVNKTTNAVFLKHLPTGIWIKCHESRSLENNRKLARKLLVEKLDNHLNGEESQENLEKRLESQRRENKKEKTRLKYKAKRLEKEEQSKKNEEAATNHQEPTVSTLEDVKDDKL